MRADQKIVVGGTLGGNRVVSAPLPANAALMEYYNLQRLGYTLLTMTDAETGEEYDVGGFMAPSSKERQ